MEIFIHWKRLVSVGKFVNKFGIFESKTSLTKLGGLGVFFL